MVLEEKEGDRVALPQLRELRAQSPLGAAPTLPLQDAVPRSVSELPSDTTMLLKEALRASPALALPETFSLTTMMPPLELDVP